MEDSASLALQTRQALADNTQYTMPDQYEGVDFEEIMEATGLAMDEIKCLKVKLLPGLLLQTLSTLPPG